MWGVVELLTFLLFMESNRTYKHPLSSEGILTFAQMCRRWMRGARPDAPPGSDWVGVLQRGLGAAEGGDLGGGWGEIMMAEMLQTHSYFSEPASAASNRVPNWLSLLGSHLPRWLSSSYPPTMTYTDELTFYIIGFRIHSCALIKVPRVR